MMDPADRELAVFSAARQMPARERCVFLDGACAGDAALRQRVEELLQAGEEAGDFLESSAAVPHRPGGTARPPAPAEKPGDRIGHYKLLQQIGEGGCGVVYMAEQEERVRRQVALKVIKLGMDTKQVIARFEAERQALALMDHPNIAKVLDAGATETGRPYFVMELVRGIEITDYCDKNNLSTKQRLDLFIQVCRAIQHAHQKGIIHRDIKPSNILVTMSDGAPLPKVIDFGIAKATHGKLTDQTLFTAFEQFLGTPAYMSPEQAELSAVDIDTRSDIYSLGVLLYELLTGQPLFSAEKLRQAGLDEIRRTIREEEPARPSTRLSTLDGEDLMGVARQRNVEAPKLIHLVRGDLDWIVMKALEKDRARRYETANGLSADIQRHLNNEPVLASPPTNLYRIRKFARRHKLAFAAGTFVAISLVLALSVATVAVFLIKQAKDDATEKLWGSYLAEARATRTSTRSGQRFASLETVRKAAAIRSDLALRNEAIACLAVSDLRLAKEKVVTGHARNELANFDSNMERYAFWDNQGNITVRAAANNVIEAVLSAPGYTVEWAALFSPNSKYLGASYRRDGEAESFLVWDLATQKAAIRAVDQEDPANSNDSHIGGSFSQDSRLFGCLQSEGTFSVYELPSGKEVKHYLCNRLLPNIYWSPANTRLACISREDPKVEIRDAEAGQISRILTCPAGVSAAAWSSDGKRLATAGMDFNIYIWEVETGRRLATLDVHGSFIMSVAFNHAGNLLVSASYDGVVRLCNADTGRQLASYPGTSWQIHFSPDDRYVLGWQDVSHYGWLEVAFSQECRQLYVPRDSMLVFVPAFSADGRIVGLGTDSTARFWDALSGKEIGSFPLRTYSPLIFPPDGRSLLMVDRLGGIRQRTLEKVGASAYRLGKPHPFFEASGLEDLSLSLDGRHLAVAQRTAGQAFIFDLQNPAAKVVLSGQPLVNRIAISPDGRWAATASWHNPLVKIWDARSGDLQRSMVMPERTWVVFSPDGRWLSTSSEVNQLWGVGSWMPKPPPKAGYDTHAECFIAFSPDSRVMARLVDVNKVELVETLTEKPLATLEAPGSSALMRCQFSPDGSQLAVQQIDQQVRLWDLRLIRRELQPMHLDWDLPPYPPAGSALAAGPVTLEVESDPASQ